MNCKIWCVRAESGNFADRFWDGGFVAIGKDISEPYPWNGTMDDCKKLYMKYHPEVTSERTIGWHAGVIRRFCQDINPGDYVITPAKEGMLHYGQVDGNPYRFFALKPDNCPYMHRLPIVWIDKIQRGVLPETLQKTLGSRQTVFEVKQRDAFLTAISTTES